LRQNAAPEAILARRFHARPPGMPKAFVHHPRN
jgi:hypothetical protein